MGQSTRLWLRRGLFPAESRVVEDLIAEDVQGQLAVYRVNVVVDGQQFNGSMADASGTLDISGDTGGIPLGLDGLVFNRHLCGWRPWWAIRFVLFHG